MKQKEIILRVCRDGQWYEGHELMCRETEFGLLGKSGDRRARELAEVRLLVPDYLDNGQVRYRITLEGRSHLAKIDGTYEPPTERQSLFG